MAVRRTVFVVGAGASATVNLPLGETFKTLIAKKFIFSSVPTRTGGDDKVHDAVRLLAGGSPHLYKEYLSSCREIQRGVQLDTSIDHFIYTRRKDKKLAECSKLAIASAILEGEERSKHLYPGPEPYANEVNFVALEHTWFMGFARLLVENCTLEELPKRLQMVSLIVFNYDRCAEHFLIEYLRRYYTLDHEAAQGLVADMDIFHPYGMVGDYTTRGTPEYEGFGGDVSSGRLIEIAGGIRTFTETESESDLIEKVRACLIEAKQIVFLGFSFHPMNMELLIDPINPAVPGGGRRIPCLSTAKNMSVDDRLAIGARLRQLVGRSSPITFGLDEGNLDCEYFFPLYQRTLSFPNVSVKD